MEDTAYRALAIVGVGATLPDAPNAPAFWENVKKGRYSISEVAPDRWDPALYYDPDRSAPDKAYSKIGGWVREYEWNPLKWRLAIPPRVVEAMDDAQKWAIACTREALNDYGYPARPLDLDRTAVILGNAMGGEHHYLTNLRIYFPEYARELSESPNFAALPEAMRRDITRELHQRIAKLLPEITEDTMPGELANCTAGRIANLFNFRGPNFTTDAACASAMAAFQAAMEGLVEHEFDQVVTGGVDRNMGASTFIKFCKIGALSATGTRPYAEGADGFIMGEGAAVFLLKRLADAERDGDKIYAVVRGLGGSSDGKGKGITAPNPIGQKLCIERAWKSAGVSPATATMIEGHGTSTSVGDAVEAQSMVDVLCAFHLPPGSVALGSVKSNFGHLKGAAGAAGLLKATFALRDKVLPPSLHCERPNPNIDFAHSPLYVNTQLRPWTATADGVRRAGASAFGFGGTNFHVVLEEYIPHRLNGNGKRSIAVSDKPTVGPGNGDMSAKDGSRTSPGRSPLAYGTGVQPLQVHKEIDHGTKAPLRGALVIGAVSVAGLAERLRSVQTAAEAGRAPAPTAPANSDLRAHERVVIDYFDAADLAEKSSKALKALAANQVAVWKALRAQGIFRGHGPAPKVAFLYTGQGSQYANMLRELRAAEPIVAKTFAEADRVMAPLLGKLLSDFVFVDPGDAKAIAKAEEDLRQTEITQPTVLAIDMAMTRLLAACGIQPDMTMGHSLGEYGALVAAGALPFDEALEAVSARGRGMAEVAGQDNGRMAAVFAPLNEIEKILKTMDGYVVVANVNSNTQAVIGGASQAVERAMEAFLKAGYNAVPLPVSHAFHTSIVAPASEPLRRVLEHLHLESPRIPTVANVNGEFYPTGHDAAPQMVDILARQVASPVQFVKGLHTLYEAGARVFVEVGPKKALQGFAEDVLGEYGDAVSIFTNHPKVGDILAFNQALCGLFAAGLGRGTTETSQDAGATMVGSMSGSRRPAVSLDPAAEAPRDLEGQIYHASSTALPVTITGAALGLPGTERIFDDANISRILRGDQFIDVIPTRFRRAMLDKHITRLVKSENGGPTFEPISTVADVIKLAGRGGAFDPEREFGISADRLAALDRVTQLAIGVGLDALRDAGIPLVMRYKSTSKGTQLPDRWGLPDSLRDDTGIIFASIFPGYDSFAHDLSHYYADRARREQLTMLEGLRAQVTAANGHSALGQEMDRRIDDLRSEIDRDPFAFDRRFVFRILAMGHSQFAEFIGARGPNTQINAACASTTQAVALAQDWIHAGRCRRVIVVAADDPTSDTLMEWMGAGFLASGAAATDDVVEEAALPFDRRRHGLIIGMGAAALVVESAGAARERGIQPICEILSTVTANSAFHGTRLDLPHICRMMEGLVAQAEVQSGIPRQEMAPQMVFVSHETYTPARGGSASAEINALRHVFGDAADQIVITNTKGFTGHSMGTGIEDVVAVKALETGCVPPVANFKEMDPELGPLNLSKGGTYPVSYALRLGAGFGSQISMTLLRWAGAEGAVRPSPRSLGYAYRIIDPNAWNASVCQMAGSATADLEVVHRTLRVRDRGLAAHVAEAAQGPVRAPVPMPTPSVPPPKRVSETKPAPPAPLSEANSSMIDLQAAAAAAVPTSRPAIQGGATSTPPVAETVHPTVENDPVKQRILTVVAEKTGYPIDMLDLDLDLEADLGVDTVKQAEVFATVRETYGIARDDKLKLRDFPTLAHMIRYVHERRPDLAGVTPPTPEAVVKEETKPAISAPEPVAARIDASDGVKERVLALVVEKTGYPKDMLDLDLDLEADLGIDTVKQAEMFAAVRETYNIPRDENLKLRDFPTLARVIQFVFDKRPDLAGVPTPSPVAVEQPKAVVTEGTAPTGDDQIKERVLEIVAEKTGYPKDMLDLELDLEADLGIDTVKQAEMFASVRAEYHIPRDETMKLRDFPTLAHVIKFARDRREGLEAATASDVASGVSLAPADLKVGAAPPTVPRPALASLDAANSIPRRVPVPILRPPLNICKPTGVTLGPGVRVIMMPDKGGVGEALAVRLQTMSVEVLRIEDAPEADALTDRLKNWLSAGPVQGVYWLPALDSEGSLGDMDLAAWREALRLRVKSLYIIMRALYAQIAPPGTFLVSATRLGGQHGYDQGGATAPLGGAVVGFTKAYKRECMEALVKAVDFEPAREASEIAQALIEETLSDPGAMEIGYKGGERWTVGLQEQSGTDGEAGLALNRDTVFLITGAAGSIVSAITADLAAASGGIFYLVDLVPEPDRNNPDLHRLLSDKEGLKRDLFARLQARGERATPALVEKELAALERSQAARSAIDSVQAAGGTAHYFSVDLKDADAVAKVIDQVRAGSGRIDVLLHAAGMERSHFLPDKKPGEFDLVFDVKSDGWFNLLHAIGGMPLGTTVAFSSIAARFGNGGQADYSAANDLLCKIASSFRTTRPTTRAIAIDWTAWAGIGMAARGSIPKMMEAAGIDMLPPEAGTPLIRRELTMGGTRGEVVIGKRLGILLNELDSTGGLLPTGIVVTPPLLRRAQSIPEGAAISDKLSLGPMMGKVTGMGLNHGLTIETTLDPKTQPFLYDHQIDGTPVLPGAMGIEAFAEAALWMLPGWHVEAIEEVDFLAPFKFYRNEPRTLAIQSVFYPQGDNLTADCRLVGSRQIPNQAEPQVTTHFTARVRLTKQPQPAVMAAPPPDIPVGSIMEASNIYRVYFHGPAYQVVERAWRDGNRIIGLMAKNLPSNHYPPERPTLAMPRLIELCFQTAGLWEMSVQGRMGLPQHVHQVRLCATGVPPVPEHGKDGHGTPAEGRLFAVVTPDPDHGSFDAEVIDSTGKQYVRLSGYRTVALPSSIDIEPLKALSAAA